MKPGPPKSGQIPGLRVGRKLLICGELMKRPSLALALSAALLVPSVPAAQSVGFGSYSSHSAPQTSAPAKSRSATANRSTYNEVRRAAEKSFRLGWRSDDVIVPVGDRQMRLRLVTSNGYRFAVAQEKVTKLFNGVPDLRSQARQAARSASGCAVSDDMWMRRYSNGAAPKYTVRLICN